VQPACLALSGCCAGRNLLADGGACTHLLQGGCCVRLCEGEDLRGEGGEGGMV
jgi:hypothetical protein